MRFLIFELLLCASVGLACEYNGASRFDSENEATFGQLCVEAGRREEGDPIYILPNDGVNECSSAAISGHFHATQQSSQRFFLYGDLEQDYCVSIQRESGYITISHERGAVYRDGDTFTWCVTQLHDRESMTVRSLAARSDFSLILP